MVSELVTEVNKLPIIRWIADLLRNDSSTLLSLRRSYGTIAYENENENESLLISAVQQDIYHRIKFKNKIDLRLT